jgi:alanine-synthesizing transaminase
MYPRPKMLILNFPANPTTQCVDLGFFERVVALCREHGIYLVHDLAYADLTFDGYRAPSVLEVPGAKDIAVEFFTLSKSYNMPGWRVGFMVGNRKLVAALARLIVENYRRRRDVLVQGLDKAGWSVQLPKATMFVWAQIPEPYRHLGSLEFSRKLLLDAKVAVSPGIGFGEFGDQHVRFSLIENEERTRQALRGIRQMFAHDGVLTTTV